MAERGDAVTGACLVFACGDPVTTRGRCAKHGRQVDMVRSIGADRQIGAALYQSAKWKALRRRLLRLHPICTCVECVQSGIVRRTTVVHHIRPHGGDRIVFFDRTNLRPMAKTCHDALTATVRAAGQRGDIASQITGTSAGCTPQLRVVLGAGGPALGGDVTKAVGCG